MKNIGLFLSVDPREGGAYQYSLSIVKALECLPEPSYRITCFYLNSNWKSVLPTRFCNIHYKRPLWRKALSKSYKSLDKSSKGLMRFGPFFNPVIHNINNSDCDVVIFPNQDPLCYQVNKKSITAIHDLMHRYEPHYQEYQGGVYQLREHHYKNICQYSSGILVDSNLGKQHVAESYGKNNDEIFVLPFVPPYYLLSNSVGSDVRKKFGLRSDFIFYPAQFWEHKNHINLIRAFAILKQHYPELQLVLSGSPKENYSTVVSEIKSLDLIEDVKLLGYVQNEDIVNLYKSALCTAFVSLIGPTNIPPLEAMILGCPLVVSNKYAMPEQVGDGALLIDPLNPIDIAKKLESLYLDKDLRKDLIEKAHKKVTSYTQLNFNQRLESIIEVVLSKQ